MTGWGVYRLRDLVGNEAVQTQLPDGRYGRAMHEPYPVNRLKAAWMVLTGRAHAVEWPTDEELDFVGRDFRESQSG